MNNTFEYSSAKIISKPTSVIDFSFLKVFHIYKNHEEYCNLWLCYLPIVRLLEML